MMTNIKLKMEWSAQCDWGPIFIYTSRYLWKWRNKRIFKESFTFPDDPQNFIVKAVMECFDAQW